MLCRAHLILSDVIYAIHSPLAWVRPFNKDNADYKYTIHGKRCLRFISIYCSISFNQWISRYFVVDAAVAVGHRTTNTNIMCKEKEPSENSAIIVSIWKNNFDSNQNTYNKKRYIVSRNYLQKLLRENILHEYGNGLNIKLVYLKAKIDFTANEHVL